MFIWDGTKDLQVVPTNHTISVVSAGNSPNYDVYTIRKNGRKDWSLFYCESGCIHFTDIKIELMPGQVLIYPPNIPQKYIIYISENTSYQFLHFTGYDVKELLDFLGIKALVPYDTPNDIILGLIKKIQQATKDVDARSYIKSEYLTLQILTLLSSGPTPIRKKNLMLRVIEEMESSYPMPYDAKKYADLFSLSVSRFNHLFKEVIGISPLNYYIRLRIDNASTLLECSDLSIAEIGKKVGYEEPFYFSQIFKKYTGTSPSEYRKKFLNRNKQR